MTNKYKKTFSQIHPSDKTLERIYAMSEKKNKRIKFKGLLIAAACITALLCGTVTANAATDGALFEGINLIINGENVDIKEYIRDYKSYKIGNGTATEIEIEVPDDSASLEIEQEGEIQNNEDTSEFENEDGKVVTYSID